MEHQSLRAELKANQQKRIDNGTIVEYKDKEKYLISPGFTTINVKELKSYLKTIGMGNAI